MNSQTSTITILNGHVVIGIPEQAIKELNLKDNQKVSTYIKDGVLIVQPLENKK